MTYLDYLYDCKDQKEVYIFDDHAAANKFGNGLRDIIAKEEKLSRWELDSIVDISITQRTVRITLKIGAEECSTAPL